MRWIVPLAQVVEEDRPRVGGKCYALAMMARDGFKIPEAVCVTTHAYDQYVGSSGLRERILLELSRKDFKDMRWEEIWDAALRIRSMFLNKPMAGDLHISLKAFLQNRFGEGPVVVRSSAPGEDSAGASFAGLHESYVNIRGGEAILEHIRLVWASLWSDAALLYRQELGLDVARSSMAVLVQEIIVGERSGVAFSTNPTEPARALLESVHGLNQGLVDGTVEPDRWVLDRVTGRIVSHTPAPRDQYVVCTPDGVRLAALPANLSGAAPLRPEETSRVLEIAMRAEKLFGAPQDVEWTFREGTLWVLQSRPITTVSSDDPEDKRAWYLTLRRSFDNLKVLRNKIENELIPAMMEEAAQLAAIDLQQLSDRDLAADIRKRADIVNQWTTVYWEEFIPFAHGVRLFGQVYNDAMRPEDPYEFMDLLAATGMESIARNQMLEELATRLRNDASLCQRLQSGDSSSIDAEFQGLLDAFITRYGDLSCSVTGASQCRQGPEAIIGVVLEMAAHPPAPVRHETSNVDTLRRKFLEHFEAEQQAQALELLELARKSYQLRDDDNIHLGRIEAQRQAAVNEAERRVRERSVSGVDSRSEAELLQAFSVPGAAPEKAAAQQALVVGDFKMRPRQLIGQPAGPGIARGTARVLTDAADLTRFKYGEVLVCDAIDPNMTFVVPLAAAVVERRGGMLIHGAIIAREYGLPCVTGVPDATSLIQTGDLLTVDGYLGIITVAAVHPDSSQ
jgi:pyruvate,water dikinase